MSGTIIFEGEVFGVHPGATVLDTLEQNNIAVPSSCRIGICQSCLMRATAGTPPAAAQAGLRDTLKAQGYFLACRCEPVEPLSVARPDAAGLRADARVAGVRLLNNSVIELRLHCASFEYRSGQFVNLMLADGTVRSYSLASVPSEDGELHLHIKLVPGGVVSRWLQQTPKIGEQVQLLGPNGSCFYVPGKPQQPLLLAGTGTGLAPLSGIVKDALRQDHLGPIHLFHGSGERDGMYMVEELRELVKRWPQFHYYPCVKRGEMEEGIEIAPIDEFVQRVLPSLKGFRVFLCGNPDLVKSMQKKTFMMGASLKEIFADSFLPAKPAGT